MKRQEKRIVRIPKRYQNAKYEDVPRNIQVCFEKIKDTRRGIYIHGGVGSGKTHIAYALHRYGIEYTLIKSMLWNVTELIHEIMQDIDRGSYNKSRVEEKLVEYKGILFLDDLGAEKLSEWVKDILYRIINKRYEEMLPIVYTSNFSLEELEERFKDIVGDRIVSRIVGSCDIFEVSGADRRISS